MPKYLHVMGRWDSGGIGRIVGSIVSLNQSSNAHHDILLALPEQGHRVPLPIQSACVVYRLAEKGGGRISRARRFWRLARDYDGFFLHGTEIAAVLPLMLQRRPCLVFQHGLSSGSRTGKNRAKRRRWHSVAIRSLNCKVICATEFAAQKLGDSGIRVPSKRIEIIPFGIARTRPSAPPPKRLERRQITVGIAARLVRQKRLDWPITSLLAYSGSADIKLLLAGEGPEGPSLRHLAQSVPDRIEIEFLGHVDDMTAFYDRLDVLLFPSRRESLGLVVLEAMDRCVPVAVFPDVGGCLPLVEDGVNGIVLEEGIEGLYALWRLLDHEPNRLSEMSANLCRSDMSEFDIARTRTSLEDLVRSL